MFAAPTSGTMTNSYTGTSRMRIVAWNLGHQTQERAIKERFDEAIRHLQPDVLILNEYVHGPTRETLVAQLATLGLGHVEVSDRVGIQNQVLIASRFSLERGDMLGPVTPEGGGQSNFLHVRISEVDLEVVGIRVPAYKDKQQTVAYWQAFAGVVAAAAGRRIVFAGDFNADPAAEQFAGGEYLASIDGEHWQLPEAEGERSFKSGSRIDHAIVSASVPVVSAAYVSEIEGKVFCCAPGAEMVSDHAALSVDLDIPIPDRPVPSQGGTAPITSVASAPAYANRGSQRWLQVAVNHCPDVLDHAIASAMNLQAGTSIEWLSPLISERFVEYRDRPTMDRLGLRLPNRSLEDFWPASGPVWDGLARTSSGDFLLVEAKAHIGELVSGGTRASEASKARIQASLRAVQKELSRVASPDWSGTFYQYANRLAHLHFLRVQNGQPAHMVFIYFLNADDVSGPSDKAEYLGALKVIETYLGLGRHKLAKYVHKVFVDVRDIAPHQPSA